MIRLLAILTAFIPILGISQQVSVTGIAPGFIGEPARIVMTTDYISFAEKVISEAHVLQDSTFKLTCELDQAIQAKLCVGNTCGNLYLSPGGSYRILFPEPENRSMYDLSRSEVQLIFEDLDIKDINYSILAFDMWLDEFVANHLGLMASEEWRLALDTFKLYVADYYKDLTDPFFMDYVTYSIANVERIGHITEDREKNKAAVYRDYLYRRPVRINHPQYMQFLDNFYENYLMLSTRNFERDLYNHIMNADADRVRELLRTDPYLSDSLIRDIVMIKGLVELHRLEEYPKDKIESLLGKLSQAATAPQIKETAYQVHQRLTRMKAGQKMIDIALEGIDGDSVRFSDFKGKYVYLTFFSTACTPCLSELRIMPMLNERYGNDFQFVSIAVDKDPSHLEHFLNDHREIFWPVLKLQGAYHLLEKLGVASLPHYILIDKESRILQSPAYSPSPNGNYVSIDRTFFELKKGEESSDK